MAFSASEPVICSAYVDFVAAITSVQAGSISFLVVRLVHHGRCGFLAWLVRRRRWQLLPLAAAAAAPGLFCEVQGERSSGAYYHRFFRVDESFRTNTRAGLTRARSLNTWVYSERNTVTHLPGLEPSYRVSRNQKVSLRKKSREKRKLSQERLLSEKTPRFLL